MSSKISPPSKSLRNNTDNNSIHGQNDNSKEALESTEFEEHISQTKQYTDDDDDERAESSPEERDSDIDEAVVDLSKNKQARSVTWKKSSLRNILTDYGLQDQQTQSKQKQQKDRKIKKKKSATFDDNSENDRQRLKRERNLQRYEDVQRMRALYYKVYLDRLKDKVELQRELIRKKSEEKESKLQAQQEKERQEGHHVKRRLQRHMLDHDDNFVKSVPKSDYYKIVALQDKLKAEGLLKTQEDRDRFWTEVKDPNMLRKYMYIYKPLPSEPSVVTRKQRGSTSVSVSQSDPTRGIRSRTSSMTSHHAAEPQTDDKPQPPPAEPAADFRPMTRIQESRESSRPVTREHTSVMATSPVKEKEGLDKRNMDPYMVAKIAAAELDKKCPAMQLPPMACFTMELDENPLDPEEILEGIAAERRKKERRLMIKRLRRMYHLSHSNGATAQRILSHHDEDQSYLDLTNPRIGDVIAIEELTRDVDRTLSLVAAPDAPTSVARPWSHHLEVERRRSILPIQEEPSELSRTTSATSTRSKKSRTSSAGSKTKTQHVELAPLSLGTMETKIIEAKCMSTLWTNYMGAGSSKFTTVNP